MELAKLAVAMGVQGSKRDEERESEHDSRATGCETDSEAASYLSSDDGRRSERQTLSAADSELILKARFEQLHHGHGAEKGKDKPLSKVAFDREPYLENEFCQLLLRHLYTQQSATGTEDSGGMTYKDFHDELTRWQTSSEAEKIKLMLSVLPLNPGTSQIMLWPILHNSLPSCYSESECKLLAQAAIDTMTSDTGGLSLDQYKRWITRNIPRDRLHDTLEFDISNLN